VSFKYVIILIIWIRDTGCHNSHWPAIVWANNTILNKNITSIACQKTPYRAQLPLTTSCWSPFNPLQLLPPPASEFWSVNKLLHKKDVQCCIKKMIVPIKPQRPTHHINDGSGHPKSKWSIVSSLQSLQFLSPFYCFFMRLSAIECHSGKSTRWSF
jgi:hypothetical protein